MKAGYTLTGIGVLPEAWEVSCLGYHLVQGATYGVVKAGGFQRIGVPMLRGGDIKGGVIAEGQPLITEEKSKEYSRTVLRAGDVVIALVGYPGESAVIPARLHGANISRAVGLLRPAESLLPEFLACYLNSAIGRQEFLRPSAGSAQIVVNLGALNQLQIPLPSKAEQRAIAAALSDVDALLDGQDRLIAKKRDLKHSVMQQLLTGQTRLLGFNGRWDSVSLGELFSFKNGLNKAKSFFGSGTPIVNYMDVFSGGSLRSSELVGRVALSSEEIRTFEVRRGDVFFTRTSETLDEIGMAAVMLDDPEQTVFSGFVLRARPRDKDHRLRDEFKAYCFTPAYVRRQIISRASYTTRALTNGRLLGSVVLRVPPVDEQMAIAEVLMDMEAELSALEARRDKTRALKQAMMQELLTGKVRLV